MVDPAILDAQKRWEEIQRINKLAAFPGFGGLTSEARLAAKQEEEKRRREQERKRQEELRKIIQLAAFPGFGEMTSYGRLEAQQERAEQANGIADPGIANALRQERIISEAETYLNTGATPNEKPFRLTPEMGEALEKKAEATARHYSWVDREFGQFNFLAASQEEVADISQRQLEAAENVDEASTNLRKYRVWFEQQERADTVSGYMLVALNSDFDQYSQMPESGWPQDLTTRRDFYFINDIDGGRQKIYNQCNIDISRFVFGEGLEYWDSLENADPKNLRFFTPDEVQVYNYWDRKYGEEASAGFVEAMQDILNYRAATAFAEMIKGKPIEQLESAFEYGIRNWGEGFLQLFSKDVPVPSQWDYAHPQVYEDLGEGWILPGRSPGQYMYDRLYSLGYSAVPIAVTAATSGAGAVLSGAVGAAAAIGPMAGNTYASLRREGYTTEQAQAGASISAIGNTVLYLLTRATMAKLMKASPELVSAKSGDISTALQRINSNYSLVGLTGRQIHNALVPAMNKLMLDTTYTSNFTTIAYNQLMTALSAAANTRGYELVSRAPYDFSGNFSTNPNLPAVVDNSQNGVYTGSKEHDALNNGEAASQETLREIERNWHGDEESATVGGESKIFSRGETIPQNILITKPKYAPVADKWLDRGGEIVVENGVWEYINADGIAVKYINGYPDFKGSGLVIQEVDIGGFENYYTDFSKANALTGGLEDPINNTWHHYQDQGILQEINKKIHMQFTHRGGMSVTKEG